VFIVAAVQFGKKSARREGKFKTCETFLYFSNCTDDYLSQSKNSAVGTNLSISYYVWRKLLKVSLTLLNIEERPLGCHQ